MITKIEDKYIGLDYIFDYISNKNYCLDSFDALTRHIKVFYLSRNIVDKLMNKFGVNYGRL